MKTYDTRLSQILESQGLTQKELADRTGLSAPMISCLVSGERSGTLTTWFKIAGALNVKIDDLIYVMEDDNNAQT